MGHLGKVEKPREETAIQGGGPCDVAVYGDWIGQTYMTRQVLPWELDLTPLDIREE